MEMKKIGVVGAGMMGAEIALCFAIHGYETILGDISQELADKARPSKPPHWTAVLPRADWRQRRKTRSSPG